MLTSNFIAGSMMGPTMRQNLQTAKAVAREASFVILVTRTCRIKDGTEKVLTLNIDREFDL